MKYFNRDEMQTLDDTAVEHGLTVTMMMENAALRMMELFLLLTIDKERQIDIVCGTGNNGGDGIACARHLYNRGYKHINIYLVKDTGLTENAEKHLSLIKQIPEISTTIWKNIPVAKPDVIIDALLGYNINGNPRHPYDEIISWVNTQKDASSKIIAFDIPSGLEVTENPNTEFAIQCTETLMLAVPKIFLKNTQAKKLCGDVYLSDLHIPEIFYKEIDPSWKSPFATQSIIQI